MFRKVIPIVAVVLAIGAGAPLAMADQGKSSKQNAQPTAIQKDKEKDKSAKGNKNKDKNKAPTASPSSGPWNDEQRARYAPVLPAGMTLEQAAAGFPSHGQAVAALNAAREHNVPFVELKRLMLNDKLSLGEAVRRLQQR
jgi:hypothetical protein